MLRFQLLRREDPCLETSHLNKYPLFLPRLARRVLVYTGTRELRTPEGIEVWPLAKFLTALAAGTLWP